MFIVDNPSLEISFYLNSKKKKEKVKAKDIPTTLIIQRGVLRSFQAASYCIVDAPGGHKARACFDKRLWSARF